MKWRQRDVAVNEALRAALIGFTYGWPCINMPYIDMPLIYMPRIDMPHINNPRFRLHYTLHYIDMPCIDMPRFRLHRRCHLSIYRVSMAMSPTSQYVMAPSRQVFHCHLSITLSTQDLSLQIQALLRDLRDHTR
jgi:hypothetical protein